ncbi:LPXTG cell wall anchor domain-containing protein [Streptomyces roseirectus]|uniref:LPXTG cell wall anchor domain-containing protein n=1 Tax=Streptomyces roseirectus TaxID=2768066 RepID=A0A7H0IIV2_9ACTN|nr:LPXTG cell wall anchor domain-containing protein [Streptomyces roseirectus]QNP72718.1 LPXTG cell wall anchor domain-containing protein [Streptomyces roseirectus]
MSSRRSAAVAGVLVSAGLVSALVLAPQAGANGQEPGSAQGGKAVDPAPAGVKLTTTLPVRISVDNSTRKTSLTATVKNEGTKESGKIRLLVVGFDGLSINKVEGCTPLTKENLPEGSNSGFNCPLDNLAAGATKSYAVDASYDLTKKGRICLPVQAADGSKTFWQQGPVPFGTVNPAPNAPATPLLLGTDNKPVTPGTGQLPSTGPAEDLLPLGATGAALLAAGAAGVWWSRRRTG